MTALLTVWMFTPHCDGWAGWAVAMALQGRKSRWWLGRRWCAIPRTTSLLDASGQPAAAGGEECLRAQRATTEKTNSLCCVSPVEGFKASILVRHRRWLARRSLTWENVLPHYTRRAAFQTDLEAIPAAAIGPGSSCNRPAVDYAAQTGSTSTIARPLGELIIPPPSLVRRPSRPSRAAISIATLPPPLVLAHETASSHHAIAIAFICGGSPRTAHTAPQHLVALHPIADGRYRAPLYPLTSLAAVVAPEKTGYVGRHGFAARASARKVGRI